MHHLASWASPYERPAAGVEQAHVKHPPVGHSKPTPPMDDTGLSGADEHDLLQSLLEEAFQEDCQAQGPPSAAAEEPPAKRQRQQVAEPPAGPWDEGRPGCTDSIDAHQQQEQQDQAGGRGSGSGSAVAPPAASLSLLALDELLLLRVLSHLSPEDLLALSQTCRYFRDSAASDGALWRRLYHARWPDGPQQEDAERVQGSTWKVLYLERDQQAVLEARQAAPSEALLPIYLQMATARRSEALGCADAEGLYRSPANNRSLQLSSKVDAFRRQRGLTDAGKHATHSCQCGCTWAQLDHNAWICEKSGFVHVCNADCAFRELDPSSDLQVCTISGRCFTNMLTEEEEHAGERERGQSRAGRGGEQEEEGWGAEDGISGRLGRAFYAGYNAETPEDFFRRFGVRF